MIKTSLIPAVLLCFCFITNINAQSILKGKTVPLQEEYKQLDKLISEYNIYELDISKKAINISSESPRLIIELGTNKYDLNLYQNNLNVPYKSKENTPLLLGGSLRNGGSVSLTINDGFIYGFIKNGSQELYIEPLSYLVKGAPSNQFISYYASDVKEDKEHICGVTETHDKGEKYLPLRTITSCKVIELAIANTYDMITKYGGNTGAENHNLGVLNNLQTNYRSEFDVNIEFEVVEHYFPTAASQNPLDPMTSTTDAGTLLANFRSWARGPGNAGGGNSGGATGGFGVDYNMASLWTDRDISFNGSSGVVGLAYTPGWHHLLEDYTTSAPSLNAMVTHEKGHNFSATHDASGSNFIMAPSVTLTPNWSAASKTSINSRVNAQAYLSGCSTLGAPTANFFQSAVAVCTGSTIEFEDQTQYGETRDWEFTGGSPTTSTEEKQIVTYNTAGLYAVKIEGHNATGSDTYYGYVDIEAAPPAPCTPSGGTGGSGGITVVAINGMNNGSTTTGLYEDFACDAVASLEESTSYTLTVGVQGVTRLMYFIDYNDDGDFLDTNESSGMYSFSGNGNLNVNLTTPAGPIQDALLRFRVIVSTTSIGSDGCTAPSTGQVEDYSFYFGTPQVLGCTDPAASNYDPAATIDNGTCTYGSTTWYFDGDLDGFGDANNTTTAASQPSGYVANSTDCDDNDANNYPGNTEVCDGQDNDCDGQVDEGVQNTYYADSDGDGFGDSGSTTQACSAPAGYVTNSTDCDDNDANNYPGNTEVCDGQDNDCDGQIDEGVQNTYYADSDGDGFGDSGSTTQACSAPAGYVTNSTDCDDNDANNYPGNTEVCDGQDNDCDGQIDEGVQNTYYADSDGDGYGNSGSTTQACSAPSGYVTNSTDCDDNDANNYPGNTEVCDGQDNNCNGLIDENGLNTYYADADGDGYGDSNNTTDACAQPSGYVANDTDCDDNDANNYPGNTEVCDGQDNDCDGQVDEGVQTMYFPDTDGDGYGDSASPILACSIPFSGYVANSSDCDDNDANNYPGNTEVCDGQDNDCDGQVDEGCSSGSTCDGAYLVINVITQNTYSAQIHLESTASVSGTNDILFTAGTEIDLLPGFEVILGTEFEARIEACTPFAPTDPVNASSGIDDMDTIIQETFGPEEEINVTIINIDNIIQSGGLMKTKDLKDFVSKSANHLQKGTYKVIFNNMVEEFSQDLLIIK